jgi:hypothetical protein
MRGLVAVAIATLALAAAPGALAAQRFAAPTGAGTECTQGAPCSLGEAVGAAKAGDEVIVGAGTYPLTVPVFAPAVTNVQIHGEPGGPMPRITASFPSPVFGITQAGDSLAYLEIEDDANGGAGVLCLGSRIERVKVKVVGAGAVGAFAYPDCLIRNSLFRVEGTASAGLRAATTASGKSSAAARNVTAIASGSNSFGAVAEYNEGVPGTFTLELENSILQGTEADLRPSAGAKGPGEILATHDNFDTASPAGEAKVIDGGGNQTAAPLFVNSEGGDYREAPGSPTIDAGLAGELGPLDLGGNPRVLGAAPDIGAYEFVPVPAPAPGQIQSLAVKPSRFRAGNVAGAVVSRRKKAAAPIGTTVTYSLSAAGTVGFSVERGVDGRRVGKTCQKKTAANGSRKRCTLFKPIKGGLSVSGIAGSNAFKFSGRIGGKSLKPGSYRLTAAAGGSLRKAAFTIVK